jgi:hypothetical protein
MTEHDCGIVQVWVQFVDMPQVRMQATLHVTLQDDDAAPQTVVQASHSGMLHLAPAALQSEWHPPALHSKVYVAPTPTVAVQPPPPIMLQFCEHVAPASQVIWQPPAQTRSQVEPC